jgi:pimeloyl-[acyl-carrier protein] methyl ester esterase
LIRTGNGLKNSFSLLLLPGFDGTGELFRPLQSNLDKTIDTRVCRYSTEESFEDYVETATAMLPQENAVLLAESFSGPVALAIMARYPGRIVGAVLCATFAVSPFRSLTSVARILPTNVFHPTFLQRYVIERFCLNGESDEILMEQVVAASRSLSASTIQRRLQVLADIDMRSLLPRISVPVLYLQSMRDRIVGVRLSRALTGLLPKVTVRQFEGPHLLLQSRPAECAAAIGGFLLQVDAYRKAAAHER